MLLSDLLKIVPNANKNIAQGVVDGLNKYSDEFGIDTPLRKAHFIAQIAHESASMKTLVEYGNGKGKKYYPYRGSGLIQLTWEYNYKDFYNWCKSRGLNPPEFFKVELIDKAAEFPWAFLSAVWFWNKNNLNSHADKDDIDRVTRIINGGYNGLADRKKYLVKAKEVLGITSKTTMSILEVQKSLNKKGYKLTEDGKSGPNTINAIKDFQKKNGLIQDGIVGAKTIEMLLK